MEKGNWAFDKRAEATDDTKKYYQHLVLHLLLLASALVMAGAIDFWLWQTGLAILCGAVMVQIGFAGHDVDHGQVTRNLLSKRLLSLLCWNLMLGLSSQWWQQKHHAHHRYTHVIGKDPDLFSLYAYEAETTNPRTQLRRLFIKNQHWLFWVMLPLARLYFQGLSLWFLMRRRKPDQWIELSLILLHHLGLWWVVFTTQSQHALAFIAVSYGVSGLYMGIVFCTNHLGMPHPKVTGFGKHWQIAHTRNVKVGRVGDYLFGGLNYQIEHHLYPTLGRFRLRSMDATARQCCKDAHLHYHEQSLPHALYDIHVSLRQVARAISV